MVRILTNILDLSMWPKCPIWVMTKVLVLALWTKCQVWILSLWTKSQVWVLIKLLVWSVWTKGVVCSTKCMVVPSVSLYHRLIMNLAEKTDKIVSDTGNELGAYLWGTLLLNLTCIGFTNFL